MAAPSRSNPIGPDKSSAETGHEITNPPLDYPHTDEKEATKSPNADRSDSDLLRYVATAEDVAREYQQRTIDKELARAYRAWRNEHYEGSKYLSTAYRGRTRLFVPKTRSTIRKNMAATAASLFSSEEIVNVEAVHSDDPTQRATADVLKADLNYRCTSQSRKSGIPWFKVCMGGHLDAQLTGVTISKQYWEYESVDGDDETVDLVDGSGSPYQVNRPKKKVIKDKPKIAILPIENVFLDPSSPWDDPIQDGSWVVIRYPMKIDDVRHMMDSAGEGSIWLDDVTDELLMKGRVEHDRSHTRRTREGGDDRYEEFRQAGKWVNIWINENFIRLDGVDHHFWSVGRHGYLSKVQTTEEAYPALGGDRPFVMGVSQIDTHRVFPMSPVESWQPIQQEINDITNLRLDTLKRSIAPLAIVKRGKNVDITQLQRRGRPDAILQVDHPEDVTIEQTPGPSGASYTETSVANSNFDELAGSFSTSSVQQSRQLNETVGGMKMMSGAANALTEFDLRVWSETWVEPVMRQVLHLLQYHESDEKLFAIAGKKAQTMMKYGVDPKIDDLLEAECTLRVSAGIGSLDPAQKIGKIKQALDIIGPIMEAAGPSIKPNAPEIAKEILGIAGFRDGERFLILEDPSIPKPPTAEEKHREAELELDKEKLAYMREKMDKDNNTRLRIQEMADHTDLLERRMTVAASREESALRSSEDYDKQQLDQYLRERDREHDTKFKSILSLQDRFFDEGIEDQKQKGAMEQLIMKEQGEADKRDREDIHRAEERKLQKKSIEKGAAVASGKAKTPGKNKPRTKK